MRYPILFALLLGIGLDPASAQAPQSLEVTLVEAQEIALKQAFSMQYARLDKAQAERDVKELLASGLPQINLVADYSQYIDIPTQVVPADAFGLPSYFNEFLSGVAEETGVALNAPPSDPNALSELQFGQNHTANVGVQATQLLFSGSYFVGLRAAQLYAESKEQSIQRTADEVRQQVAQAYHVVLGAAQGVMILEQALQLVKTSLQETQQLHAEGFVNQIAVDQLELAVQELELEWSSAKLQVPLTQAILRFQMGVDPNTELTLKDSLEDLLSQENGLALLSQPFNAHALPGIQLQESYVELAGLDVRNQQAKGLPQIAAFYTNQGNAQRDAFNFFDADGNWYPVQLWGVNFSMPLWTSFGGKQQVEKKRIQEDRAIIGLERMRQSAQMEFDKARLTLELTMAAYQNRTRAETIAQRIFDQTYAAYQEGLVSSFEWTQARNQLLEAQGNSLSAVLDWLNAQTELKRALSEFE
ncbi:MAG: TolC family protein [Bacteroidetes bacterium]|nr:TolC family protein [Bacteroidota bacterium]